MDFYKREKRKIHPKENAGVFSYIFFLYTFKLFKKGFKKQLQEEDLYEVPTKYQSHKVTNKIEQELSNQITKTGKVSMYKLLWTCYGFYYIFLGISQVIVLSIVNMLQPEATGKLVSYFTPGQTNLTQSDAYYYATVAVGADVLGNCIFLHHYGFAVAGIIAQFRAAFSSLIYRRALTMKSTNALPTGKVITLITKDINAFHIFLEAANSMWIALIKSFVAFSILYMKIGYVAISGVAFLYLLIPLQVYLGRKITQMKIKLCKRTDQRLQLTQEALSAIRIIKMYTWEKFFENRVNSARKSEMKMTFNLVVFKFLIYAIGGLTSHVSFYLLLMTYVWIYGHLTAEIVYFVNGLFRSITWHLVYLVPAGINSFAEVLAAIKRMEALLQVPTNKTEEISRINKSNLSEIIFENVTIKIDDKEVISGITLHIDKGLTLLTGLNGSGKSVFLKSILSVFEPSQGNMLVTGKISYASQEAWLFPSTIRQNILFGDEFDQERYKEVLYVCALDYDLKILEFGDKTIVEDAGMNLSKGQQARINLARAVYRQADIYLFDDCLSALDGQVSAFIFQKCFKEFLKNKLVIFVTHNLNFIQTHSKEKLIALNSGKLDSSEKILKNLQSARVLFETTADNNKEVCSIASDRDEEFLNEEQKLIENPDKKVYQETQKSGQVGYKVYWKYFSYAGGIVVFIFVFCIFVVAQVSDSLSDKFISNCFKKILKNLQSQSARVLFTTTADKNKEVCSIASDRDEEFLNEEQKLIENPDKKVYQETQKSGQVGYKVYWKYFSYAGGIVVFIFVFCIFVVAQVSDSLSDKFISNWVNFEEQISNYTSEDYQSTNSSRSDEISDKRRTVFYQYTIITIAVIGFSFIRILCLFSLARKASVKIHKKMISGLMNTSIQFYDDNFIGNMLNRFSRDLTIVDTDIPFVIFNIVIVTLGVIGTVILVATVNFGFLVPSGVLFIIVYLLTKGFLRTSRSLQRLEASTRSPMIGYLNASLEGLTTIKTFNKQSILKEEFDRHQDLYMSAYYNLLCCNSAFGLHVDMICRLFVLIIVATLLILKDVTNAGNAGLAISQSFVMVLCLQWLIRQWADMENKMTSVERVFEYAEVTEEAKGGIEIENWPLKGKIVYKNLHLTYNNSNQKSLRNISVEIEPGEKLAIIGRTGAGKSSLIYTLFRLYNFDGKILIDGTDIKSLTLNFLRSNISIVPSDPLIFTGTVRENVDPLNKYEDEAVWKVLKLVNLHKIVPTLDLEIGNNFSIGQKQLICLARAAIHKSKILVLDEASSNVDSETDKVVEDTIEANFSSCTVLKIAHKLTSLLNCDKILVVDKGEIVEFGRREILMEDVDGWFYKTIHQSGLLNSFLK